MTNFGSIILLYKINQKKKNKKREERKITTFDNLPTHPIQITIISPLTSRENKNRAQNDTKPSNVFAQS